MSVQQSLRAFASRKWQLVDEHPENPSGYGVDCPDCGQPMDVGGWPAPGIETGVHGFGCPRCRNVVPTCVTERDKALRSDFLRVDEALFRDGSTREVRALRTETDHYGGGSA